MIRQVRLAEKYTSSAGNPVVRTVFAFGTHPNATPDEEHDVNFAVAKTGGLRIIMDELLVGNNLEEVQCRDIVDADAFDRVPLGATPDDIARCSTQSDVLPKTCPGSNPHSVCICHNDNGCGSIAKGMPVGIKDVNGDGSADTTQFIKDAVQLKCGNFTIPTDVTTSYWYPSGNQDPPALGGGPGGFDALGPAIILHPGQPPNAPMGVDKALPTNLTCSLVFASDVVDKTNIQVCAPPNGDVTQNCTPGDVSLFHFKVEPLAFTATPPSTNTLPIIIKAVAPIDPNTLTGITINPAVTGLMVTEPDYTTIRLTPPAAGFAANTSYTITIATTVTDFYGQAAPQQQTFTIMTGP